MVPNSGSSEVSTDLIKHIRTIHYTLVVVSIALIVLASNRARTQVSLAYDQIKDIAEIARTWDPLWLDRHAAQRIANSEYSAAAAHLNGPSAIEFEYEGRTLRVALDFKSPNWTILEREELPLARPRFFWIQPPGQHLHETRKPQSLKEFKEIWDFLEKDREISIPIDPSPFIHTMGTQPWQSNVVRPEYLVPYRVVRQTQGLQPAPLELTAYSDADLHQARASLKEFRFKYAYVSQRWRFTPPFAIPVTVEGIRTIPLDGQAALFSRFHSTRARHGRFAEVFKELDSVTGEYQQVDLDTLEKIVAAFAAYGEESSFSLLGIRFPAEGTVFWGVLVIVGLQTYLWLHLVELPVAKASADRPSAVWIGIFGSRWARLFSYVSLCALPVGTVLFLARRLLERSVSTWGDWLFVFGALAASTCLAFVSGKTMRAHPATTATSRS